MKRNIFEPEAIFDEADQLDEAYELIEDEGYYVEEDAWLDEPQESLIHVPEAFSNGPTTRHIMAATLGLGFLLMFLLLTFASRVGITIQTASAAASEVQAQGAPVVRHHHQIRQQARPGSQPGGSRDLVGKRRE
jgi:hypothetical protein